MMTVSVKRKGGAYYVEFFDNRGFKFGTFIVDEVYVADTEEEER